MDIVVYSLLSCIERLKTKIVNGEPANEDIIMITNLLRDNVIRNNPFLEADVFVAFCTLKDLLPRCKEEGCCGLKSMLSNQMDDFMRHIAANYANEPVCSSRLKNKGLRNGELEELVLRETYNKRKDIAVNFYEKHLSPEEKHRVAETNGIDFRFPLCEKTTAQYKELYQWCNSEIDSKGNAHVMVGYYWSIDTATAPTALGISEVCTLHKSLSKKKKEVGHAMRSLIRLNCNAIHSEVLESTASEAIDIWSIPGAKIQTRGGGTQVFLPLPLETRRRLLEEEKIVEIEIAE